MSPTPSTMLPLGIKAPGFSLRDTEGNIVSTDDFKDDPVLLVVFMCNHCPYVKHIIEPFVGLVKEYQEKGVDVVGINSNDVEGYPEDSPANMAKAAMDLGFTFSYLMMKIRKPRKHTTRHAHRISFFLTATESSCTGVSSIRADRVMIFR